MEEEEPDRRKILSHTLRQKELKTDTDRYGKIKIMYRKCKIKGEEKDDEIEKLRVGERERELETETEKEKESKRHRDTERELARRGQRGRRERNNLTN